MSRSSLVYSICFLHICKEIPNYFSKQWNMWTETFKKNHGPCCISYCELSSAIVVHLLFIQQANIDVMAFIQWSPPVFNHFSSSLCLPFTKTYMIAAERHTHTCFHANCLQINLILGVSALYCALFFFFCYSDTQTPPHTCTHRFQLWGQGVLVVLESTVCFNECLWGHCEYSKQRKQACFFCFIFFFFSVVNGGSTTVDLLQQHPIVSLLCLN